MNESSYEPQERRPITTRERGFAKRLAAGIAALGLTPNMISVVGTFVGIAAGVACALTADGPLAPWLAWLLAAVLVQLRLLANMLDGMVAVATGQASPVGELYNEIPDRIADIAIFVGLGYAAGSLPWLGYTAALLALFTAYVRAEGSVAGAPQDYGGPLAKPQRMFAVTLLALYAGLAPTAWQPAWGERGTLGLPAVALGLIALGTLGTAVGRLLRTARHLRSGA